MQTTTITDAVGQAAAAAVAHIPIADELTIGATATDAASLQFAGVAVTARFTGNRSGDILIAVEQQIADALQNSPIGPLDLTAALAPALDAAAGTLGTVVTGPGQALDPRPALDAVLSKPGAGYVTLIHEGTVRAIVALAASEEAGTGPQAPQYPTREELSASRAPATADAQARPAVSHRHGLEMLRDVAMDVTAQIGSTRMTVSELLSLSDGAVIELDRSAGAPADLLVNGHLIARGEVVVIDENFGLRITEIVADDDAAAS
ncbi:MAG TPA: flagellar motor switch protein FliN [Jatrophihabitans sp.]|jgi:flagellar motor switch protein FliN/FliY